MSGTVSKIASERNQKALLELAIKPGNGEHRLYPDHRACVALYRFFCLCGSTIVLSLETAWHFLGKPASAKRCL